MDHVLLGIDVGSTNVKFCLLGPEGERFRVAAHDGDLEGAVDRLANGLGVFGNGTRGVVTGAEGRHRLRLPEVIAPVAVERALAELQLQPRAVVSMGGEDLVVFVLDAHGRIVSTYAGNKCASGTGEFFRQQLGRMDLSLADLEGVADDARVHSLSSRCSVFMKSDCTHRLNKGEATKGDIALSLSKVMADKVSEFLTKARIRDGQVVLIGGVTQNRFLVRFIAEAWPEIDFVVPEQAPYFEAFGAAHLAAECGGAVGEGEGTEGLVAGGQRLAFANFSSFDDVRDQVRYLPSMRGELDENAEYILGVDGGSTTTKVALVRRDTLEVVAEHYGRTHGDPVAAVKDCLRRVRDQLGGRKPRITLAATTGSSRELLGVFLETNAVYNEIIAHTVGTTYFEPEVDTIFEIGGQDAKYVLINNGVPIDYAMNEACSAGTGSFLEESAAGDLSIRTAREIGPIALQARAPLKFGEHCSAFINSDIRKAISQGAEQTDIVAGLVFSIVANYLNRVVGNRTLGDRIVLQGGVAKNEAVPLAFARMTGKQIVVPPDPELMGCFGVALLARQKLEDGLVSGGNWDLDDLIAGEIVTRGTFVCKACENRCDIRRLEVAGHRYPFGGRCSMYTNMRKKRRAKDDTVVDWTAERSRMLFEEFAPDASTLVPRTDRVVGVPRAFSVHSLWPFYAWYFHSLGVRVVLSERVAPEGIARQESNYCFPAEIAHGAVQDVLDRGVDFLFLPHFRDMPSMEADPVHACVCPLTQGLPFYIRQAFAIDDDRLLRPLVSFKEGWDDSRGAFEDLAERLGFSRDDGSRAYDRGMRRYRDFLAAYRAKGEQLLAEIREHPERLYVALVGRPYNAFTRDANMGIPRKITSQGVSVVPFDMIFDPDAEILANNYWFYGQQDMKAVRRVKEVDNLYLTWISNFSCAPDSFLLHYVRWMMGQKPYLVLEIDSHTADAGLDTRVEAFLDIVESYRRHVQPSPEAPFRRRFSVVAKEQFCDVVDAKTGERIDIRDPRVTLVWPSMGELSSAVMETASTSQGIRAVHLPVPDVQSTQLARTVASGKECIPSLLVLGSVLKFFQQHPPNRPGEIYVVVVPSTLGPCRTGQYHVFYERLFEEMGWENVVQLVTSSENSYREMGPNFSRVTWRGIVLADSFWDIKQGIRLLAKDVDAGLEVFERGWERVRQALALSPGVLGRTVAEVTTELAAIPKWRTLDDVQKVLILGEIYVRRDDFSVQEVCDFLLAKGIYPKIAGVSEWFHYTDFARHYLMKDRRRRDGLLKWVRDGGLAEEAWFYVEEIWKGRVERDIHERVAATGLVPDVPHDVDAMIRTHGSVFVEPDMESEATISPAVGAAAMQEGYSGIAIIAPFGCLIGRVIEGVYAPWAKARGYPVIALENDGQPYPPNIIARMEVFAHNVLRFEPGREDLMAAAEPLPVAGSEPNSCGGGRGTACASCSAGAGRAEH
jgi:predicted CoA-substrate-specific enzyme activase